MSRLDVLCHVPVEREIPAKRPSDGELARALADVYSRETPAERPLPRTALRDVPPFSTAELRAALRKLARNKAADSEGIALEHISQLPLRAKKLILGQYNKCLNDGAFPKEWLHTTFTMLPKPGDASKASNWRPIAVQRILYKILAKMLLSRISPRLEAAQGKDQCAYRPGFGADEALHCVEHMVGFAHAFKQDLWIVSLDLSKAFDKVFHESVIEAILQQGVDEAHASLLQELYWGQTGQVGTSDVFQLFRGVRQGDVLSPCLFNAVMEMVFNRWKDRLTTQGWEFPGQAERFTNIRFADDVLLYARSLEDAKTMLSLLIEEFQAVGLQLNAAKTKILSSRDVGAPPGTCKIEWIAGRCFHVLSPDESHAYLGRALNLSKNRATIAVKRRISAAWHQFQKKRQILMSQHVGAGHRIKLFNSTVLPVLLYGLASLALKPQHHAMLRGARTKMLRNMAGWRRAEGESWQDTMRRMQTRVSNMLSTAPSPDVSERVFSLKWRLARRLFCGGVEKWAPVLRHLQFAHKRARGRPPLQWMDGFKQFYTQVGADSLEQALQTPGREEQYIKFCMMKL